MLTDFKNRIPPSWEVMQSYKIKPCGQNPAFLSDRIRGTGSRFRFFSLFPRARPEKNLGFFLEFEGSKNASAGALAAFVVPDAIQVGFEGGFEGQWARSAIHTRISTRKRGR